MNLSALRDRLRRKADDIQQYLEGDAKHIVGQTAVDHFRKSFENEGFTDELLNPWQEVERRKPESPWYGHSGETGRYSPERTKAPILTGETGSSRRRSATPRYLEEQPSTNVRRNKKPLATQKKDRKERYLEQSTKSTTFAVANVTRTYGVIMRHYSHSFSLLLDYVSGYS